MKREWSGLLLILLFVVILGVSSCGPQVPGSAVPKNSDTLPEAVPLDADLQKAQDSIRDALNDPAASVEELLEALGTAQMLGVEDSLDFSKNLGYDKTVSQLINERVQILLMQELLDPLVCKKRAWEILALAQQLGYSEVEKLADAKTKIGAEICGEAPKGGKSTIDFRFERTYDEGPDSEDTIKQKTVGSISGQLQERTIFGQRAEGSRNYALTGDFTWSYEEWWLDGCIIRTTTSSGTESAKNLGYLTVYDDGKYNGDFNLPVKLQTQEKLADVGFLFARYAKAFPQGVDEPGEAENIRDRIQEECNDARPQSSEEESEVEVNFDGTAENYLATLPGSDKKSKTILTDSIDKQGYQEIEDTGNYLTKITYSLELPN